MEFSEVVRRRRMVRSYDRNRDVSRETLDALLGLAIRAPSAGFTQGWEFLVLDTRESVGIYWELTTDADRPADTWLQGMRTAPVLIVAFSDKSAYLERYSEPDKNQRPRSWTGDDGTPWPVPYWHIDTGMASLLILLGAVDAGLAGCFFGLPADREPGVRAAFRVPDRLSAIGVLSLGYPAPDRRSPSLRRGRRPVTEVAHYGTF